MGTLKMSASSLMDLVSTTATASTSVISSAAETITGTAQLTTKVVKLGNNAMDHQLKLQTIELAIAEEDILDIAVEKSALARDDRLMAIKARNMSPEREAMYNAHCADLYAKIKAKTTA